MKTLIILGTSREDSNTLQAIQKMSPWNEYELVDLQKFHIQHYEYDTQLNKQDDFLAIAQKMQNAENIIFATPVYWYAMSGRMKVFFDRLTDLLSTYKTIGKSLRGKKTYLLATGTDAELPLGFEVPFQKTSEYFDMEFQKTFYWKNP